MNPMSMQFFSIGQLAACAAFLMLAYAGFLLLERRPSLEAKVIAIGFAYSGVGILAQTVSMLRASDPALGGMWNSLWFNLLFNFPRPWVLLLVAVCVIRLVKRIPAPESETIP
jgi:hypothetical protein